MPPVPVPTPTPADLAKDDWEKKFFEKEGITDDKEKDIIRSRARVIRYAHAKTKAEEAEATPKEKKEKKWYESEEESA